MRKKEIITEHKKGSRLMKEIIICPKLNKEENIDSNYVSPGKEPSTIIRIHLEKRGNWNIIYFHVTKCLIYKILLENKLKIIHVIF